MQSDAVIAAILLIRPKKTRPHLSDHISRIRQRKGNAIVAIFKRNLLSVARQGINRSIRVGSKVWQKVVSHPDRSKVFSKR
ncbi:hypothetical protein FGO68_gene7959 [Halteria grandinella]|uniref:Uncharacterized protein n=1 Tax=Halteria grandinella TaxID=5974 RepID=A0A8J8T307_HALGN|nr:hypothetical protein FGO68_gene7959 [Halteria grandinella]